MKLLLTAVNAKYIHSNLAVYSLASYARYYRNPEDSFEVETAEFTINHQIDYILENIYKRQPDVLCFSCYIWNIRYVEELIREYHRLCPDIPIWVGGPEVSYEAETFLRAHQEVTGVMIGEGEETFLELCGYYAGWDGKSIPEHIKGIAYQADDFVIFTETREPVEMSKIPFCYDRTEDFKNRIIYYESGRGCPFHCSYCLSSVDRRLRFRDVGMVKKELAFFMEREVPQVKFVDRTFNCKHEHAMEIWRFIKEHDNGITNFHFEISADLLTEEEIELIGSMRPGLIQLEIGVQSTNQATIQEIHRTMQLNRLKEAVRAVQAGNNIHEHLDLIAGLPYEDYDTFAKSFDEIYALKPNQLQLGFLKVLKGSYMYEHAKEYGILYHAAAPYEVLRTAWLDYPDILRIKQAEEMLEVYYNSGQFEVTLKILETQFKSAFLLYQRLGEFYEQKGYFQMSHSRMRRYEILLEFAEEQAKAAVSILRESLIYDLYSRENCKSRPSWAADMAEWKEVTRMYCKNGKQSHVERFFYSFPQKTVRTIQELPEQRKTAEYIRFDYTSRSPLDHQALTETVEAESSSTEGSMKNSSIKRGGCR